MKTKYICIVSGIIIIAVFMFAGVKNFIPNAVTESTSQTSYSATMKTVTTDTTTSVTEKETTLPTTTQATTATTKAATTVQKTEKTTKYISTTAKKEDETEKLAQIFPVTLPEISFPSLIKDTTTTAKSEPASLDDCVFVGNSRFISFKNYGLAKNVYPVVGLNVDTVFTKSVAGSSVPVIDELNGKQYDKIILMFGDNECGWPNQDVFISKYAKVIAAVRERMPEAEIYLHSILPVSAAASAKSEFGCNNTTINKLNAKIEQLAADEGIHYIPQPACLKNSDGALLPEAASDGIHLNKKHSEIWINSLTETIL